jgi:hypothetical protein
LSALSIALLIVFLIGVVLGVYAILAPRRRAMKASAAVPAPVTIAADTAVATDEAVRNGEWTKEAGQEFEGLSESARCEMIFAAAALDSERPQRLLEHALGDSSETVALAAAHALARNGRRGIVERYLATHPGERAERIAHTLSLLELE